MRRLHSSARPRLRPRALRPVCIEPARDERKAEARLAMFAAVAFLPRGSASLSPMREALTTEERRAANEASRMAKDMEKMGMDDDDEQGDNGEGIASAAAMMGAASARENDNEGEDEPLDDEEEREDAEALHLRESDFVFLALAHDDDAPHGDVCVFEPGDGNGPPNVYVHHDFLLAAPPLCCDYVGTAPGGYAGAAPISATADAAATGVAGRAFAAIGTFETAVEIWDLDVIDAAEPACVLGGEDSVTVPVAPAEDDDDDDGGAPSSGKAKAKKKAKKKAEKEAKRQRAAAAVPGGDYTERQRLRPDSHRSSVLCVGWNRIATNLLASGSADETVKLWDIVKASCVSTFDKVHSDKVQALIWHTVEPHVLLTGGYDRRCVVTDLRSASAGFSMPLSADVEACCWDAANESVFYASSEDGVVCAFDIRRTKSALFTLQAHERACTNVVSAMCAPGALGGSGSGGSVLVTASTDKTVRVWDAAALQANRGVSRVGAGGGRQAAAAAAASGSAMLLRVAPKVGAILSIGTCSDDGRLLAVGGSTGLSVVDLTASYSEQDHRLADGGGDDSMSSSDEDSEWEEVDEEE